MNLYLERYFDIYKKTQKEILELQVIKSHNFDKISQYFNRIRIDLDTQEQILKTQYANILIDSETTLKHDFDYLTEKCQSICDTLNTFTQTIQDSSEKWEE